MKEVELAAQATRAGRKCANDWRRGASRSGSKAQASLRSWEELAVRADALESAASAPRVRVALMGRVKAGKSTLVNGLFGRTVAATHVNEQTSALHELLAVGSRDAEGAELRRRGGTATERSPEELAAECGRRRGDADFWGDVVSMCSRVHAPHIDPGLSFFDTPGVSTTTTANASRAVDFIDASHVILWVTSGRELGNADDARYLEELRLRGRPVLPIITRADTIDEDDQDEVTEWFEDNFEWLGPPIFTAATDWCEGRDLDARDRLLARLDTFADENAAGATQAASAALGRDVEAAAAAELADLRRLITVVGHIERRSERAALRTVSAVEEALRSRVDAIFERRWELIRDDVEQRVRARQDEHSSIEAAFNTHLAEDRMGEVLRSVEEELQLRLEVEWSQAFEENMSGLMAELASLEANNEQAALQAIVNGLATEHAADQRRTQLLTAGTATTAAAATAWTAWFGAHAAAISLGSAFVGVGLPIIGVGALAVIGVRWLGQTSARAAAVDRAKAALDESKRAFVRDVLEGRVLPQLTDSCERIGRDVAATLVCEVTGGVSTLQLAATRSILELLAVGEFEAAAATASPLLPEL